jgi:Tfp pilus assembly PilM family ATPase
MYYYAIPKKKKKNLNGILLTTSTTITIINDTISYHQNTSISNYTITASIKHLISIVKSYVLLQ